MAYVDILQSLKNGKYYIGSTINLEKRLKQHNAGHGSTYTRINKPWILVLYRKIESIHEARIEEKRIKSFKSGNSFKSILNGEVAEWPKAARC